MTLIPALGRLRKKDYSRLEMQLNYIANSRPAYSTQQELVSKKSSKPKERKRKKNIKVQPMGRNYKGQFVNL